MIDAVETLFHRQAARSWLAEISGSDRSEILRSRNTLPIQMHELAITQSVVDMVVERTAGRRVAAVRVRVGDLSGVVPDAMQFCYDVVTAGTDLEGSRLVIERSPGSAHCRDCNSDFTLADLILLCPCGSANVQLVAGSELEVASVDLVAQPCA
jgi:hydrogenase nickel incorporation protein HypA/HybF